MTKTKKLNKIIPAVLLSSAMVISTPNLISPIVANALESNNTNNYANENCPLTFEFYSNGDDGQKLYISANGKYTNKVTIAPNNDDDKQDIIIKDLNRVNNLTVDITKSTDSTKYDTKSNNQLKVEFYVNNDTSQPIYVLQNCGNRTKHVNNIIFNNNDNGKKQTVSLEGLNHVDQLTISVSKCSDKSNL